jgi:mxaK protein
MATSLINTSLSTANLNTPRPKFTSKKLTWLLIVAAVVAATFILLETKRIMQIEAFNQAVTQGKSPETDRESFEAKFATAYWLAKKERFKESALIFSNLLPKAKDKQKAAIYHNIGNIYFLRGLAINGTNNTVRDEAEYLLRQAKAAYVNSLKIDNTNWKTKHNLDRILTMLPSTPTPGVGGDEKAGLIMGNIPVGLP